MIRLESSKQSLNLRLGSDAKTPIVGTFEAISGLDLLLQDIQQLILTIPGERVMRPEFGCALKNQLWENLGDAEIDGATSIRVALDNFEPRITVIEIRSETNENTGLITFNINFIVNSTDTSVNLVFPFRAVNQLSSA